VGRILADPDWYVWDCGPIYGEEGKVHAFIGRWPKESRMAGWLTDAEIAHAVADRPSGPYRLAGTVLAGRKEVPWADSVFNSTIHKVGDRYALFFAGHSQQDDNLKQQIGLAVADSLNGPWRSVTDRPIIPFSGKPGSWNCLHASNPAFLRHPNGQYWVYYKGISDTAKPPLRTIGLAIADELEGPYRDYPGNPLISYVERGVDIEDPYAFHYSGRFYLIMEDRLGVARYNSGPYSSRRAGGIRPGLLYESRDGIRWGQPKVAYWTSDHYFGGPRVRMERPQILWKNGQPDHLFLAMQSGRYGLPSPAVLKIAAASPGTDLG